MKKFFLTLLLLPLLIFTFVGCNDDDPGSVGEAYTEAGDEELDDENVEADVEELDEIDDPEDEDEEEEELDNYTAIMLNKEMIISTIEALFPVENAFDVQVKEDGTLLLFPNVQEWRDFQSVGFMNAEVGDVITDALVLLSEIIYMIGISGVQINLMMTDDDEEIEPEPVVTVEDGEIGINLLATSVYETNELGYETNELGYETNESENEAIE